MDSEHDHFFAELYGKTTAPFLTQSMTERDVRAFHALARPPPGATILDLGCGWGRHLQPLRAAGFRVLGTERSVSLSREAQARVPGTVVRGDLRALPLVPCCVDFAACFYSSLFLFDEADNRTALAEVSRVLKPGGALFLQTANPIHLRRLGPQTQTLPLPDGSTVFELTTFDLAAGREHGLRRLTRKDGTTLEGRFSVRYYAPGELDALAHLAGMRVERVCGDHDLGPFTRSSRDLLALVRKPG